MNYSLPPSPTSTEIKQFDSVRFLTRMLVFSGLGNCAALLIGCYGCFAGNFWLPPHHLHQANYLQHPPSDVSLRQTLHHFQLLSLHQLVECLAETSPVAEGYRICDLALGYLVSHHHFDLARAIQPLVAAPTTELALSIEEGQAPLTLYLGLTPAHYDAILAFGRREQWPIDPQALFSLLKGAKTGQDRSLREAFCLCLPFQMLQKNLLGRGQLLSAEEGWNLQFCLDRILEGDWEQFMNSCRAVAQQTGSIHLARQTFLAYYPADKDHTKQMCVLKAEEVATSPSLVATATVKQKPVNAPVAAAKPTVVATAKPAATIAAKPVTVAATAKPASPASVNVASTARAVAIPALAAVEASRPKRTVSAATYSIPRLYVVRSGDSLWKIARTFQVDVDKIKSYNALKSDQLSPGSNLMIP